MAICRGTDDVQHLVKQTIDKVVWNALLDIELALILAINRCVPDMRHERVESLADAAAILHSPRTNGDYAFAIAPENFHVRRGAGRLLVRHGHARA